MSNPLALIVDDEPDIRELLEITLLRMGLDTVCAEDLASARNALGEHLFDLCLLDMHLPDGDGIDLVREIAAEHPETPVAMITAHGNMETAIEALKAGAFDFVSKPVDLPVLRKLVNTALKLNAEQDTKPPSPATGEKGSPLRGTSPAMEQVRTVIAKLARSQAPVHITGESGTGKELAARMIHQLGPRQDKAFVAVNCGAIPHELMESELFGHKKGSFTGAIADNKGLFLEADGGTLFLDEVADLPLSMQVKLLRVIQEKRVRPVGATREAPIDVRIISATHQNLARRVEEGLFRQDLYYRLNVIELNVEGAAELRFSRQRARAGEHPGTSFRPLRREHHPARGPGGAQRRHCRHWHGSSAKRCRRHWKPRAGTRRPPPSGWASASVPCATGSPNWDSTAARRVPNNRMWKSPSLDFFNHGSGKRGFPLPSFSMVGRLEQRLHHPGPGQRQVGPVVTSSTEHQQGGLTHSCQCTGHPCVGPRTQLQMSDGITGDAVGPRLQDEKIRPVPLQESLRLWPEFPEERIVRFRRQGNVELGTRSSALSRLAHRACSRIEITAIFVEIDDDHRGIGFESIVDTVPMVSIDVHIGDPVHSLPFQAFGWRRIQPHHCGAHGVGRQWERKRVRTSLPAGDPPRHTRCLPP